MASRRTAAGSSRPFSLHWGDGHIIEEARAETEHTAPAIQLMQFETGEAAGSVALRFCHFSHDGRFQRSPMILAERDLAGMREALERSPQIARLLRAMLPEAK